MSALDRSLIYVSRKTITDTDEGSVEEIVAVSRTRNATLGVTGTLLSAGGFFAQILEGQPGAIDALMDSIHRDARHRDVCVLRTVPITERSFPEWSMAYSGPSSYLARTIAPLIGCDPNISRARIERLISLMTGLANETHD